MGTAGEAAVVKALSEGEDVAQDIYTKDRCAPCFFLFKKFSRFLQVPLTSKNVEKITNRHTLT